MHYILFYTTVDNYVERRAPFRAEHLAHARAHKDDGTLIMAGAFADPADGAALVFTTEAAARGFAERDPYVAQGLVERWWVRAWNVVV